MPGRDGTGPYGTWANCNGRPALSRGPGFGRGPGKGRGAGFGHGYGMGAGYVAAAMPVNESSADTSTALKNRAVWLENELTAVKNQLNAISASNAADGVDK